MKTLVKLENIYFSYPAASTGEGGAGKSVLRGFSLHVMEGETLVVAGKSGCGKTTLLRLMAWLEEPSSGQLLFRGRPYASYDPPGLRRKVSLVSQTPVMMDGSVRRNLGLGLAEPASDGVYLSWMERLGLEKDLLDRSAESLSVGQAQRVAVIRSLLIRPEVLLLDEPTSGLDPESAGQFREAVGSLSGEEGLSIVWNSHDVPAVESMADRIIHIAGGNNDN